MGVQFYWLQLTFIYLLISIHQIGRVYANPG